MIRLEQRRAWFLVAAIAIGIAILLLLVPQADHHGQTAWLALLPVFFIGLITPLSLISPAAYLHLGFTPESPVLSSSFQRPPPFPRA